MVKSNPANAKYGDTGFDQCAHRQENVQPINPSAAVEFAKLVGKLKTTPRTGWVRRGVPRYESVADHSWRVAMLSLLLSNDDHIDVSKCMAMAMVHDVAESIVGDIAPDDNVTKEEKARLENDAMTLIATKLEEATMNPSAKNRLVRLFHEYEDRESNEAKAVKDLDMLDMIIQASEYEERFDMDLSEFFETTPVSKFRTPMLQTIASHLHTERTKDVTASRDRQTQKLTHHDQAFVDEFAKASQLDAAQIESVVQALRRFETSESD